jgi:bla regulator protein blaR1
MMEMFVNHLWQSTLFAAAVGALAWLLRDDAARVRYWLWFAASVKFLVPFAALTTLGAALARPALTPPPAVAEWYAVIERAAQPMNAGLPAALAVALGVLWACGVIAVLANWLVRRRRLSEMLRTAVSGPLPGAGNGRVACALPVRYSSSAAEPGIVGFFRPLLVLPRVVEERLSAAQLDAVVEHELTHWRHRDNLTASVHMLVEALFWFHPLVWWIGARLVEERERACDEAVVRAGHDRGTYAEGLLRVCELNGARSLPCASGAGGADLKARITSIMRRHVDTEPTPVRRLALAAAAALALLVPVLAGFVTQGPGGAAWAQESERVALEEAAYLPIVRVAPVYPQEAAARGLEGHVLVELTVTRNGSVRDVFVVESSDPIFEEAALAAASRFRYRPAVEGGSAVEVPGVRNLFTFVIEEQREERAEDDPPRIRVRPGP